MEISGTVLAAILGMALVTYATRAGGFWLAGHLPPSGRVAAGLRYAPGAVLAAIIVPAALDAGPPGLAALVLTVIVARRTGSLLVAAVAGVVLVAALRALT
jgi:uncharacterized membrane protein